MAEKKFGLSAAMIISSIAVGAAAGVIYYYRKAEIKKLAEDIIARVKPVGDADDEPGDWDIRSGMEPEGAEAADVNIVDSGISLEDVEAETGSEADKVEAETEADGDGDEDEDEDEDEEDDIERPKKPWFWSK